MTRPAPGMDHALYPFAPLPARPKLVWPGGGRLAVCVLLHLEHWELDPPKDARRDARFTDDFGSFFPEFRTFSRRDYGARHGLWRVLRALEGGGLKLPVAGDTRALQRYPQAVAAQDALRVAWVADW